MSDPVVLLSTGDVVGPAGGVTNDSMVLFNGTSGKLIKGNNAVVTAAGLALLDDVNAAAQRVTLGLGTAATATLTTSAADPTAGRVLKVGDFGLGTTAVHYGGDLNLLGNVTGFYRTVSGATNFPNGCLDSCFVHIGSGDTYSQTIVGYNNNRMYTRGGAGVVPNISWQPWVSLAKTNSETFTGTTTFSGDTDTSGFVRRFKGGNPTTANQGLGVSSDGSVGEHCFGARAYGNVAGYSCYFGRVDGVNPALASWYYSASPVGTITTNGSSTSYNTTSDYRLKADVTDLGYSLERIQGLKPKAYRWLSTDKWGAGFLAHELAVVMPDAVTGEKDAVKSILDEAGEVIGEEVVPQVVDYSKIVVYLVGAIQEQQAQIDSLVSRIAKLEDTTA